MKRTSPLKSTRKNHIEKKYINNKNDLLVNLTLYSGVKAKLNFELWLNENPDNHYLACVLKVAKKYQKLKKTKSHDSLEAKFNQFQLYVNFCKGKSLNPFSEEAYKSYVGKNGELRRLEALAISPYPYIFMYQNNEQIGLSSSSCKLHKSGIVDILKKAGVYDYSFEYNVGEFSFDKKANAVRPYSDKELSTSIRRLQYFFYSLSSQLIAIKKAPNEANNATCLMATVDKTDQGILEFEVKSRITNAPKPSTISNGSPFNRAMQAGYYLFCYFTSFNESSIYDVCHPLEQVTLKKSQRTVKTITFKAWKSRASREVEGLVSDEYLTGDVEKKDGLKFLNTLIELSKLYNPNEKENNQPLIYFLDNSNKVRSPGQSIGYSYLSKELGLFSDDRGNIALHLAKLYMLLHDSNTELTYLLPNDRVVGRRVSIQEKVVHKSKLNEKMVYLGYSIFRCFTDENLKNAIRPLKYKNNQEDGFFEVQFSYNDNPKHICSIKFPNELRDFVEVYEKRLNTLIPVNPSKHHAKSKPIYPPYLFATSRRANTPQWEGIELTSHKYLQARGITNANYYLNLSSRRFRATTGSNYYSPTDGGYELSKHILNNTFNTLSDHYVNGNEAENKQILGQALEILTEVNKGNELPTAKELVKKKLKIDVLSYDEWKSKRLPPPNLNGIVCNGKPELDSTAKNQFNASLKFASILLNGISISCYQFDKCSHCKSAKIVNDVRFVYKTLSYIEALRERIDRMPLESEKYLAEANYLADMLEANVSEDVLNAAYEKLDSEGPSKLISDHFVDLYTGI